MKVIKQVVEAPECAVSRHSRLERFGRWLRFGRAAQNRKWRERQAMSGWRRVRRLAGTPGGLLNRRANLVVMVDIGDARHGGRAPEQRIAGPWVLRHCPS